MTRVVVVGHGMVGSRFVEDLLAADTVGRFDVTVLGAEECEPYNRVLLSEVVAGRYDLATLTLPASASDRLTVLRGTAAAHLDRADRVVTTTEGSRHRYDVAVLATGSRARIPALAGLGSSDGAGLPAGVHPLRTIDDAREIVAATLNARRAVVLGAGVLGMEAACGLARRGVDVTVVHPMAALMERQLDAAASRVVEDAMTRLGIDQRVGVGADAVVLDAAGRLAGVRLVDGEVLPAELLVVATGTVAETALARAAGLTCDRGVVVGADLASVDDRRVFALGDCAQPPEGGTGLVAQGWEQARRLAARLTARSGPSAQSVGERLDPGHDVVRLKAHGLDVVTMGVCGSQRADDPAQRTLRLSDPDLGRHVEVVVSGGLLVGATCVGAGDVAADLVATYTRRTPVPADPAYLLLPALAPHPAQRGGSPVDLPDDATVCRCNGVTKHSITACVDDGAASVEAVAAATRATTGCGGCIADVCALVDALVGDRATRAGSPEAHHDGEDDVTKGKHVNHNAEIGAT
jgi:assimilatory nitrate reductase electron transfer subunit